MKKLHLHRFYNDQNRTLGMLTIVGDPNFTLWTCENPWLDNTPFKSCIPRGVYTCKPFSGTKYKEVYQVMDVADRWSVLIHWGNTPKDTQGCILLGLQCGEVLGEQGVLNSKKAVKKLKKALDYERFELTITGV